MIICQNEANQDPYDGWPERNDSSVSIIEEYLEDQEEEIWFPIYGKF